MIRIEQRLVMPAEWLARAEMATREVEKQLSAPANRLAQQRIELDAEIWLDALPSLRAVFCDKCAFCEIKLFKNEPGFVGHFRPPFGVESLKGSRDLLHYSWLAYAPENLLIECLACNTLRRTTFPVDGARAPVGADIGECRRVESGTLLDPCVDNPAEHLVFERSGLCTANTRRGQLTIDLLRLNEQSRVDSRRQVWNKSLSCLQALLLALADSRKNAHDRRKELGELVSKRAPHTAVARAAVSVFFERLRAQTRIQMDVSTLVPDAKTKAEFREAEMVVSAMLRAPVKKAAPQETKDSLQVRRYRGREELPAHARRCISRIEIRKFKSLDYIDLKVPANPAVSIAAGAAMLLGENATGKSSVLEAVALALLGTKQIVQHGFHGADFIQRDPHWREPGPKSPRAEIRIWFEDSDVPLLLAIDPETFGFVGHESPAVVLLGYGPRRYFTRGRGVRRSAEALARVSTLFDPTAAIANPSGWLMNCSEERFNAVVRALRPLLMLPDDALVRRPPAGQRAGEEVTFEIQGNSAPLGRLSEGYKTIVAVAVDIMREMLRFWPDLESARGVVLIDEIETHLHPRLKMRIVHGLRQAMPQVQFFATTHDPLSLRGLHDGEVHVLRRNGKAAVEQVANLPCVRGLSVEQLLTSDYFGLFSTEDPRLEEDLLKYTRLAARRNRSSEDEEDLADMRDTLSKRIRIGESFGDRLIQEAAKDFLIARAAAVPADRPALRREVLDGLLDLLQGATGEESEDRSG